MSAPLSYLLGVHDSCRMGALRFRRDADSPFLDNDRHLAALPVTSLRELEAASLAAPGHGRPDPIQTFHPFR